MAAIFNLLAVIDWRLGKQGRPCMVDERSESGGDFLLSVLGFAGWIDDGDAILETNPSHHLGQKPEAAQLAPTLFRRQCPLEHQAQ